MQIQEFFEGFLTLQDQAFFHSLADISGRTDWMFRKILPQMYVLTRKSPVNFLSHLDPTPDMNSTIVAIYMLFVASALLCSFVCILCVHVTEREKPYATLSTLTFALPLENVT